MSNFLEELRNKGCEEIVDLLHAKHIEIDKIDCGIVFVVAYWSGQAKQALNNLAEAVGKSRKKPTLILVDNDEIDVEWMSKFFHDRKGVSALHGFGETLLVKNGKVYERLTRIHESSAEQLAELIEEFAS